jgi:hypothetical protein
MRTRSNIERQLRNLAGRLELVTPRNREEQALLGHLLGAIWALLEAERRRLEDRSGDALPSSYTAELRRVARALAKGQNPTHIAWSAEFHFNSGLYRLGSLAERLGKYCGQDRRLIQDVSKEVQRIKHDIAGLLAPRSIGLARAATAASQLVELLEEITRGCLDTTPNKRLQPTAAGATVSRRG